MHRVRRSFRVVPSVVPSGQSKPYQTGTRCKFGAFGASREYQAGRGGQKYLGPVYRGGSWRIDARHARSAFRSLDYPGACSIRLGFRPAR